MRIGLIYLGRRGAGEWISFELARQLRSLFPTLSVISSYAEQLSKWKTMDMNYMVTRTYRGPISAFLSLLVPVSLLDLVHKINSFQPIVLLFPMFHPWNAVIQMRMPGTPSVVFVHDPRPHPDLAGWLYGKLEQISIRKAERCIIMSESLMVDLIKRGVAPDKIDVIPLGMFRNRPSQRRPHKEISPTILFFGRIVRYKGLDILLQAYADVRRTHRVHLLIAGEGSLKPFQGYLDALPDVEVINHWIPDDEIENLFSRCDLLVLPYSSASQSGVIPIAASFGLPVIATRTGGIPEQIEDGISGWLVEPGSQDALADAIKDALDHPEVAHERGVMLKSRYENQFNWERIARRVGESLKKAEQARGQK